jgi:high-affinity nickel-transport protein
LLYALGHATTVAFLGVAVIALKHSLPESISGWMQRIVGLTLILLGAYVFGALLSGRGPMGRGQAILAIFERLHWHKKAGPIENQRYGSKSSLSLGVLHGIGAETPTQLSMLVIATNMGGLFNGVIGLTVFAIAMFLSNMVLTTAATSLFTISRIRPVLFRWLGVITAGYSFCIGIVLITS